MLIARAIINHADQHQKLHHWMKFISFVSAQ